MPKDNDKRMVIVVHAPTMGEDAVVVANSYDEARQLVSHHYSEVLSEDERESFYSSLKVISAVTLNKGRPQVVSIMQAGIVRLNK